ncbi:Atxe2 family lasso peptide isopeptidase (plasmid) [Sphingomonas paeninsulae]|uniref:Atxe2 family lasso peptide isopeptidase n=1 Tax=Sphingomonas paeninsulae TaxID=2319844 RepID=A0A494T682_SPHPE|nr:Atxe2 family lasso peptide isopeptidase [Sphingomonas paeninsulae]AYJ84847.1 Atxe2 family lasso peptide isopeptidase [Sphingomonas paeninsulae]
MVRARLRAVATAVLIARCGIPAAQAACAPPPDANASSPARDVTTMDIARLRDIGLPDGSLFGMPSPLAISPDGRRVAFLVNQGDPATDSYCRMLMVADIAAPAIPRIVDRGGELIRIVNLDDGLFYEDGFPDVVTPAWSPDGRSIGYLRRDHGITQVWRVGADGGAAAPVTNGAAGITDWAWLSNEAIVVASRPGLVAERARIEAEGRTGWLYDERVTPQVSARPQAGRDAARRFEVVALTYGARHAATPVERAALAPERVSGNPNNPDMTGPGGWRAWVAPSDVSPVSPLRIHLADANHRERPCTAPQCSGRIVQIFWGTDGRSLVYLRREGFANMQMAFYRWGPASGAPQRLGVTSDVLHGCLPHGALFLCTRETSTVPRQIALIDPATAAAATVYDPNPEFATLRLGKVERLTWRNNIGLPAWGDLVLPPAAKSSDRLPLIVVQYNSTGFLRGGTGDEYPIFALAAHGFAVLSLEKTPNVARAFPKLKTYDAINAASVKDWAERRNQLSSILTGVALAVKTGTIDPKRIGITGLSDGSSSVRFALVNSRVFAAAAISTCCVEPKTAMTYGGLVWARFNRALGFPLATQNGESYWKPYSMALNASVMDTPILMQLADDELLLSLETFTALRENHKPVELYAFPDEHHNKWHPAHRLAIYDRVIDWFDFWLRDTVDPDAAKTAQYVRWRALRALQPRAADSGLPAAVP